MVFFLGTLVLLFVMGVIWMFIRVEPAEARNLPRSYQSGVAAVRQNLCLGQRPVVIFDDNRGACVGQLDFRSRG